MSTIESGVFCKKSIDLETETFGFEPALVSNFFAIREDPEISPDLDDFPDVFSDKKYRKHAFGEATKAFEFVFDKEKLLQCLQQKENKDSFAYLKKVRRHALIIRDLYRFFDSSHKCVEKLGNLAFLLGQYNDSYWVSPSKETRENIISNLDDIKFPINFSNTAEFKKYTLGVLLEIQKLLKEKELPVDEFHTLRKRIRSFASIIQPVAAENCGGNFHWLFFALFKLSGEMGDIHDDLINKGLVGEIEYDKSVVKIDPRIVSKIKTLEPFIEKACGLYETN
jgi:hypothetical protein